jgi:deoxyribonuclease I
MLSLLLLACVSGPPGTDDGVDPVDGTDADPTDDLPCDAVDDDADGVDACDDCDDGDAGVYPGAPERCDGRDNDCDDLLHPDEADGSACQACDEAGFWATTRDLTADALVAELHALTADQDCADYSAETTWMFVTLDKSPDGFVTCVYTGRSVAVGSVKPDETDMNTEHSWPQSLGADSEPAKCDLHHLFPTDADANNARGNLPFAEVAQVDTWWDSPGESALGDTASGATAFEPRAVHQGNAARAMLYFAMRYGYSVPAAELATYRAWHAADPVDDAELARTLQIRDRQGEANPYVVCPELVDRL